MHKLLIVLSLFIGFSISSCKKNCDDPQSINFEKEDDCAYIDTTQAGLMFKVTGTWCAPCGSYGAKKMKQNLERYPNLIGLEIHSRDVMSSTTGDAFKKYFKTSGVPAFYYNGKSKSVRVATSQAYQLGLHMTWNKTGKKIDVKTFVQSKEALNGEYNIAIYLVEDGHVASQKAKDNSAHPEWEYSNGKYPNYIHTNILKGEASNNMFGTLLTSSGMSNNAIFENNSTLTIDYDPQGTVYPVVVVWKKDGVDYTVVNAISGKDK